MKRETPDTSPLQPTTQAREARAALSRLYLTLFLRGSSARGLSKPTAPSSIPAKLLRTLAFYAAIGLCSLIWLGKPVVLLSLYLHGLTFFLVGTFIVASAGSLLFNPEEADILLHRPVTARALLFGKVSTLCRVSLWLAGALNLVGSFVGLGASDGNLAFPLVHAVSTSLETLFVAGLVVLVYELCLRWFGRERLDSLITFAQVLVTVGLVVGSQAPRFLLQVQTGEPRADSVWLWLFPPAWFASIDAAFAGSAAGTTWLQAACALISTGAVLGLAFGKLSSSYDSALQRLTETAPRRRGGRRLAQAIVDAPPLCWWLRQPAARAALLLSLAYLARDRDTKLRVYPMLASVAIIPLMAMAEGAAGMSFNVFIVSFGGAFIGLNAMVMTDVLRYSQHYRAAELFHLAPLPSPAELARGVRAAVLIFLVTPAALVVGALVFWRGRDVMPVLIPGMIAAPMFSYLAQPGRAIIPLSRPPEEARPEARSSRVIVAMLIALFLSAIVSWAWITGWFVEFVLLQTLLVGACTAALARRARAAKWPALE